MKVTTVLAIIFGPLLVGALLPLVFGGALRGSLSEGVVCEALGQATKRGFLTADAKKKLLEEALKSDVDAKTRTVFEAARVDKNC